MDHRREHNAQGARPLAQAGEISRRAMVAGTIATTAVVAVLPLNWPTPMCRMRTWWLSCCFPRHSRE